MSNQVATFVDRTTMFITVLKENLFRSPWAWIQLEAIVMLSFSSYGVDTLYSDSKIAVNNCGKKSCIFSFLFLHFSRLHSYTTRNS